MGGTQLTELRAEIERKQAEKVKRYGVELKQRALGYLRGREAEGGTSWVVSQELGLGWQTLRRWAAGPSKRRGAFRRVAVGAGSLQAAPGGVVVHGPHGLRIEGLGVAELAALLRAL
jgi:transposase